MSLLAALLLALHPPVPAASEQQCTPPEGWEAVEKLDPKFVIFGEIHGSVESPAFIGDVACGLLAQGKRILVGIEFHATLDGQLQAAWQLPDVEFRKQLSTIGWAGRTDGVASHAMFDLLLRLHSLKDKGAAIDIVAFSGPRDIAQQVRFERLPRQGPHEAAQAENIANAAKKAAYDVVLVLVGDFHARRRMVGEGPDQFEPMALRLAPSGRLVSLQLRHAGGTSWNCQLKPGLQLRPGDPIPADAIACGAYPVAGNADLHHAPFLQLGPGPGDAASADFDGFFWVGPLTASPPQIPAVDMRAAPARK